ncbi:hypothetical protein DL93DRAFT_2163180 [Clavulina sp. PMI_390]|nr:hypothetical protein DL93DRAFT_2163180 [Clavulina sp. PMI_390]
MAGVDKFNKDSYIGAWLVCEIVSTVLFGILTIQCILYLSQFKRDNWGFKALVLTVWVLDFGTVAFGAAWTYLAIWIKNYGLYLWLLLATLSFVCGVVFAVRVRILLQEGGLATWAWLNYLWFFSAATTDLLVAFIVVFSLGGSNYSYSRDTKRGLRKLIFYTISNGILTSVFAVAGVALSFAAPHSWIQPGLGFASQASLPHEIRVKNY